MSAVKSPSEVRRSSLKHDSILFAAADMANSFGYENSTIEGVAAKAGVGKQTIYRWWPSKAELYLETYRYLVSSEQKRINGVTGREQLHRFLCQLFRIYKSTAAGNILVGLVAESTHNNQAAAAIEQGLFIERSQLLIDPIKEGIVSGELDQNLNPGWAAEVIVALIWKRLITTPDELNPKFSRLLLNTALGPVQK